DKYKGLFAEGGEFDIPSHYSFGVAFVPAPGWTLAADYGPMSYTDVASVSNPSSPQGPLGAPDGPGLRLAGRRRLQAGRGLAGERRLDAACGLRQGRKPQ
ncbi:MAG: long-chain fatty acid transporter, partial [Rubrivivax sp.]|nr:long-chain fatty acid transporter [Rubrivivax sp.]